MAALHNLPVTVQTMDVVLSRLRNVKRLAAPEILQTKVAGGANNNFMTLLDASQCAGIVQAGMTDRYIPPTAIVESCFICLLLAI